ncbi:type II CAAX prenyl endopeptidase Rce1 family protein [Streptomyces sp. NPDC058992]|uniref:CPBP family glutamic-type intramembrane protease n=1 Tax=Streptomyces sp. NPDC058992 TaxID=3346688 RepID=UPI0036B61F2B
MGMLLSAVAVLAVAHALVNRVGPVLHVPVCVAATAALVLLARLWHIAPSRGITRSNAGVAAVFGTGGTGVAPSVGAAVVGTALAGVLFCELRRRSGSLIPSVALHCALNSAGYAPAWTAARAG